MHRKEVKSKFLKSVGYDADTKILEIEFLRTRNEDARKVYQYFDVPMEKVLEMSTANSMGSYFLTMIKPNYKCVRILEEQGEKKTEGTPADPQEDSEKGA